MDELYKIVLCAGFFSAFFSICGVLFMMMWFARQLDSVAQTVRGSRGLDQRAKNQEELMDIISEATIRIKEKKEDPKAVLAELALRNPQLSLKYGQKLVKLVEKWGITS